VAATTSFRKRTRGKNEKENQIVPTSSSQVEMQPGPYNSSSSAPRKTKSIQEIYMAFKRYI
jgi:hypothetical protein